MKRGRSLFFFRVNGTLPQHESRVPRLNAVTRQRGCSAAFPSVLLNSSFFLLPFPVCRMKFTDGQWLLQPGVTAHYAAEAHSIAAEGGKLVVHAPVRPIRDRGDTLQGPLLTVTLSSPLPDIVRVRIEHFTGGLARGPQIPLVPQADMAVDINDGAESATLTAGELTARVKKNNWGITFEAGGRVLTTSGWRGMAYMQTTNRGNHVVEQLSLGVGECVYGLGERFTAFVKNGQVVEITNKDGGTASEQAYKNVPFYLTNRGYGVLVNETGPVSFEVASEKVTRVQFSLEGESLEYFLIYGPTPKDILRKLTALTGRPALPPAWSFGLWLSTSFTTNYDEATVTSFIEGMKQRDLPLHVFHFDCFWMREFEWTNFEWDPRVFPDPAGMLQRLHARGLKICVWINSYIAQRSRLFAEGRPRVVSSSAPTARFGKPIFGSRAWPSWILPIQPPASGSPVISLDSSTWAWTQSRPTLASGSPPKASFTTTAPIR